MVKRLLQSCDNDGEGQAKKITPLKDDGEGPDVFTTE